MAEYESIHGTRVRYLSSDPTLDSSTEGQVWYNSTTGTNKALVQIKAVSSGGNTPTNFYYAGGVGPTTATLGISGVGPSPQPAHNLVIEYNGFSWSSETNIPVVSRAGYDFGTATAAVYAGGDYSPGSPTITAVTREYDGSSWTTGNNIPSGQGSFGAATGVLTAGLCFGGYNGPQAASSAVTVSYDGTNWTDLPSPGADTNTLRNFTRGGGGPQTAAIFSGGNPTTGATEAFDGSSWTSLNSMNTARYGSGFNGTQTIGIYMGGVASPGRLNTIEEWDGVNWSTSPATLTTATNGTINSKGGSVSNNIIAAGWPGSGATTSTQEYNSNINAITKAAWSSGNNLGTARMYLAGFGTQDAGLAAGGATIPFPSTAKGETEEYNGTSWSEQNNLGTARKYLAGCGTQTAGLAFGGGGPYSNLTEEYDGSNWTSGGNLGTSKGSLSGFGIQTAGVAVGGYDGTSLNQTEEYNGTSWTAGGSLNTARYQFASAGVLTAGLAWGGQPGRPPQTEEYNGTAWTIVPGTLNTGLSGQTGFGTQTAAVSTLGIDGSNTTQTEVYDGTNWTISAPAATARRGALGAGTQSAGLAVGGYTTVSVNNTEEFTGGTEVVTASTLTTS